MVQTRGATPQAKPGQKHISYGRIRSSLRVGSPSRFTGIAKGQAVSAQPGFRALLLRDATPRPVLVQLFKISAWRNADQFGTAAEPDSFTVLRASCKLTSKAAMRWSSALFPHVRDGSAARKRVHVGDLRLSQRISAPLISKRAPLPSPLKGTRYTFNLMAPRGGEPRTAMASLQGARFRTGRLPRRSSAARSLPRLSRQGRSSARTPATAARRWKD